MAVPKNSNSSNKNKSFLIKNFKKMLKTKLSWQVIGKIKIRHQILPKQSKKLYNIV